MELLEGVVRVSSIPQLLHRQIKDGSQTVIEL